MKAAIDPRLLSREQAAAYCGVGVTLFEAECPVIPIKIRSRVLYDRAEIDRWIDSKAPSQPKMPSGKEWLERLDAHASKRN